MSEGRHSKGKKTVVPDIGRRGGVIMFRDLLSLTEML
jgi:hypothetical protein